MATESGVILPADSTGKALRTETVSTAFVGGAGSVVHQQVVTVGDGTSGATVGVRPDNSIYTDLDPSTLLYDGFDTLDTANTWTTSGTAPTLNAAGYVQNTSGTTASAASRLISQTTFLPGANAFLKYAANVQIEAAAVTNSVRWWGIANPNTSAPTVTTAIANGAVFEVGSSDGALYGRVYSGNAKIAEVALTRPSDGQFHRYQILFKASKIFFDIDGVTVGTLTEALTNVAAVPISHGVLNFTSVPATAPVVNVASVGVADTGHNFTGLRDGTFPWRKAAVTAKGTQGGFGLATQDLKDAGRTGVALSAIAAAGVTTETLLSASVQRNGTAVGAAATQTVTAGKTLRITNISISTRLGAAAVGWSRFTLRSTYTATTATVTSAVIWAAEISPGAAAVAGSGATMTFDFPDGIELPSGSSFGLTHISSATTNVETVTLTGFEY